jgi:hypothetical protein
MEVLLSILLREFRRSFSDLRTAGERHADDLPEDEFFDQ